MCQLQCTTSPTSQQLITQPTIQQPNNTIPSNQQTFQIQLSQLIYHLINQKDIIKPTLDNVPNKSYQYRNSIIDLTINFHRRLKLNKFVLFEAISIINRYIHIEEIQNNLPIVAITSLIISQKKTNIKKFKIQKWLQFTQITIPIQNILQLQQHILEQLDYSIDCYGNSLAIAYNITQYIQIDLQTFLFCRYLLELSFYLNTNYQGCQYLIALSCFKLSCHFLSPDSWNENIIDEFEMSLQSVDDCCCQIFNIVLAAKDSYPILYQKFKKNVYHQVSLIEFGYSNKEPSTPQTSSQQDIPQKLTHTPSKKQLIPTISNYCQRIL